MELSHNFKEEHKLSQSNLCSPATCGYFVSACRYRDLPYDCKPFCNWKSTVCEIVVQVCNAIVQFLLPRYIRLPQSAQEIRERIDESRDRAGFPQVVDCVDGCHIPIKAPQNNPEDYVNRKGFHSIILQGLVDANYLFLDACGWVAWKSAQCALV